MDTNKEFFDTQEADPATVLQAMQAEFKLMCEERERMLTLQKRLEVALPLIDKMAQTANSLAAKVKLLMDEREVRSQALIKTLPSQLRPSVSDQLEAQQINDCWEKGSRSQTPGMEPDPRERNLKSRSGSSS